jgi:hypothetical protein
VQGYLESASILSDPWQSHPWQPCPVQLTASMSTPDEVSVDCHVSSAAGTSVGVVTSGQQFVSDVSCHLVLGNSFPASTQSECFMSVPCEACASHSMSPPFEQVASMSASLDASDFQVERLHVLKPRGCSGQIPSVHGCNQCLKQSDNPIDMQCRVFDV